MGRDVRGPGCGYGTAPCFPRPRHAPHRETRRARARPLVDGTRPWPRRRRDRGRSRGRRPLHRAGGCRAGRARGARVAVPAGAVGQLLGAGRARGGARAGRQRRAARSRTRWRPAADACSEPAGRGSCARRLRTGCASWRSAGIRFDASADGELLLSLEGGHTRRRVVHAGGSATGRHVTARLSELVTAHDRDRRARAQLRARRCGSHDGRCAGS